MATVAGKRKAPALRDQSEKRQRVENSVQSPEASLDDEDHEYNPNDRDYSDDERTADTPLTPFSPGPGTGRKKFPSELKHLKCTYEGCDKTFNRPIRLTNHLKTHQGERSFLCTYEGCDKAYFQDKHLQAHIKGSHTHERSYECDYQGCGKSFLTSTRLKRHKDTHIGHDRFRCTAYPPCNQTFRKHQTLQRHINSEHLQLAPYQCTYIDPTNGQRCFAGFDGANGLRQHVERIHGIPKFFCPDCIMPNKFNLDGTPAHLAFITEKEFQAHIRKEHANCPFCDIKCRSERELQKHVETMHSGTTLEQRKNVPCTHPGCDKRFTKNNNLKTHIRTAHMGERYVCGTFDVSTQPDISIFNLANGCHDEFTSKYALHDHIRTAHLGLPTVINAYKKKARELKDFEIEEEDREEQEYVEDELMNDDEYILPADNPKKNKKKRATGFKAKPAPNFIDDHIGLSYQNDPRRKIPCPVFNCAYKLMRDHDLEGHMRRCHKDWTLDQNPLPDFALDPNIGFQYPATPSGMTSFGTTPATNGAGDLMDTFEHAAGIDDELQHGAQHVGQFWMGADQPLFATNDSQWNMEADEMDRLIGEAVVS